MGPEIEKSELCKYVGATFSELDDLSKLYSDDQIAYGLNYKSIC